MSNHKPAPAYLSNGHMAYPANIVAGWREHNKAQFKILLYTGEQLDAACSERPINMVLHCPICGMKHIDAPERQDVNERDFGMTTVESGVWTNPPHRSHLCRKCGYVWRPADVPTNGVAAITTKGQSDSPAAARRDTLYELQTQCVKWGAYWRAPDAHGVELTIEQATELLVNALGVEVEIKGAKA